MFGNIQAADTLMGIFGFTRVDEGEDMTPTERPEAKFNIGDQLFVNHAWREVVGIRWDEDHYEYEVTPWDSHIHTEEDLS